MEFISLFSKYVGEGKLPTTFNACDKELKKTAGVDVFVLHGCIKCQNHVYGPDDARKLCPRCGYERYDTDTGKAHEVGLFMLCIHLCSLILQTVFAESVLLSVEVAV